MRPRPPRRVYAVTSSLASAATLFLVVSDPERYRPLLFVNTGARVLGVLVGLPSALLARQIHFVLGQGALAAILVIVIVNELRKAREAELGAGPGDPAAPDRAKSD